MPQIAQWLHKTWETNGTKIAPLEELSTGLLLETEQNEDNEGQSPTYSKKFQLQTFSLSTLYSTNVGTDPEKEKEDWYSLVGEIGPLYLGGKPFGPDEIQLKGVNLSGIVLDDYGRIREAKFQFTFEEYAPEKSAEKIGETKAPAAAASSSTKTSSNTGTTSTASGASAKDKANWQTRMEVDG